jgi:hypothetical protein
VEVPEVVRPTKKASSRDLVAPRVANKDKQADRPVHKAEPRADRPVHKVELRADRKVREAQWVPAVAARPVLLAVKPVERERMQVRPVRRAEAAEVREATRIPAGHRVAGKARVLSRVPPVSPGLGAVVPEQ